MKRYKLGATSINQLFDNCESYVMRGGKGWSGSLLLKRLGECRLPC